MRSLKLGGLAVLASILGFGGSVVAAEKNAPPSTEVDRLLQAEVFDASPDAKLAPPTNDEIFLRRVYLDVVGDPPTPAEVTAFVIDPSPDKRAVVIDRLLADPRYGLHWGRYWRDVILYRRAGEQGLLAAAALESYLTERFNANAPWDEIVRAFVTAKGPALELGNAGLFMAQMAEPTDVASETSRIFLGIQIQCAQCHDHPTDRWKREQFHEFAAFFPRAALRRSPSADGRAGIELASFDDGPEARRPGSFGQGAREHFMPDLKDPASRGTLMTPALFATGDRLQTGATDDERRGALAEWMTSPNNPWPARAFVNRLWAELVGEGFCEPIDDLGPDRSSSAPQTFDYLADRFAASGYDVKQLVRTIAGTDAYQRESRRRRRLDEPPFTANVAYRLRSDQLYDALVAVTGFDPDAAQRTTAPPMNVPRPPQGARVQFAAVFGYDPSLRRDDVGSSIPQALALMNSPNTARATAVVRDARLPTAQIAALGDEQAVLEVYLRVLAREPNEAETAVARDYLQSASSRPEAIEDLFWSLLNGKEFAYRR